MIGAAPGPDSCTTAQESGSERHVGGLAAGGIRGTFKQEGRTITANLGASKVRLFRRGIERQRKLEAIFGEMRSTARRYLEATTHGVPKRKNRL